MTAEKEVVGALITKQMENKTLFGLFFIIFISCSSSSESERKEINTSKKHVLEFNSDSAYSFVEKQVSFGPRYLSSKGWALCANYLENKLRSYTPYVIIQEAPVTTYDGKNHVFKNIIASFSPKKNNRIALFAHWDTRHIADHDNENPNDPILGANDGGSGVGVLIEIARQMKIDRTSVYRLLKNAS